MLVEGVHFLGDDPPDSVGWKLVAVNISDLAAKGARPVGGLMGCGLSGDTTWDARFLHGVAEACSHFGLPMLGGDTVTMPAGGPRTLAMTVIGETLEPPPSRAGGRAGDDLWVTGTIGDAGLGLAIRQGKMECGDNEGASLTLAEAFLRPQPDLSLGQAIAPYVTAMMDVSDGLLIDTARMAESSRCGAKITLDTVPLSPEFRTLCGDDLLARLNAATAGDDYCLLFTSDPANRQAIAQLCSQNSARPALIGALTEALGLKLTMNGDPVTPPDRLGYEHNA